MLEQTIDGITFEMGQAYDFSFLQAYGNVFKVFDDQDSGNLCFGVKDVRGKRWFIKYAGAVTKRGSIPPEQAIKNLRQTVPIYRDLRHPALIQLRNVIERENGFGLVFDWEEGECMGRMYPESCARFQALPIDVHLKVFNDIMGFMHHASLNGYVSIDFYDGSVMVDPARSKTTICDIDFFRRMTVLENGSPHAVNDMGRMWGSSRFMAPEEFELGAALNELTNVYRLGAMAFALFADYDRSPERWPLSAARYALAHQAVSENPKERPYSVAKFIMDWHTAE